MGNDLISREALKKEVDRIFCIGSYHKDRIIELIDNAPAVETMNPDYQIKVNIPEEETQKLIEELQRCRPCILPESEFTDDDIQELIKDNFNIGYEMAKNKYARPQGEWTDVNGDGSLWKCSNCGEMSCCKGNYCPDCGAKMKGGVV